MYNQIPTYTCITDSSYFPKCLTVNKEWSNCIVPNSAVIYEVNSAKNSYQKGGSINGGTTLWITGYRNILDN